MLIACKKKLWTAMLVCGSGMVFQAFPTGCTQYMTQQVLSSFDFCSVFNCEGGTFFDFCSPVALFADCPSAQQTTQ